MSVYSMCVYPYLIGFFLDLTTALYICHQNILIFQIYEFLGHIGLSYAVAFVTSLAFESPMMGLEKVIFKRGQKK